jgi:hypothetical protein
MQGCWYTSSGSVMTGNSFTTPAINTTTSYYVDATNGSCTVLEEVIALLINSTITSTTPNSRCDSGL